MILEYRRRRTIKSKRGVDSHTLFNSVERSRWGYLMWLKQQRAIEVHEDRMDAHKQR